MINVVCINMFILFINYNYFQSNPSAGLWSMAGLLVQQSLTNHFFGVLTNQFYGNKMMQNNTIITKGTLWYLYCNIQYRYNCIGRSRLHHREAIHSAEVEHKRLARGLWNHDNFCQINDTYSVRNTVMNCWFPIPLNSHYIPLICPLNPLYQPIQGWGLSKLGAGLPQNGKNVAGRTNRKKPGILDEDKWMSSASTLHDD